MKQYIKKSALVAEVEKRIKTLNEILIKRPISSPTLEKLIEENKKVLSFIDTLEVKEVEEEPVSNDLEAEFVLYLKHKFNIPQEGHKLKTNGWRPSPYDILDIAKHFAQWQKKQEIKEVDLEKEVHSAADQYDINNNGNIYWEDIVGFAKHFFELGLKAKGE